MRAAYTDMPANWKIGGVEVAVKRRGWIFCSFGSLCCSSSVNLRGRKQHANSIAHHSNLFCRHGICVEWLMALSQQSVVEGRRSRAWRHFRAMTSAVWHAFSHVRGVSSLPPHHSLLTYYAICPFPIPTKLIGNQNHHWEIPVPSSFGEEDPDGCTAESMASVVDNCP